MGTVESHKQEGQLSACEVTLVHYEDMGIPKVGVRHRMWGAVKKLHSDTRAYQPMKKTEASLSRCALMAQITTKASHNGGITQQLEPESSTSTSKAADSIANDNEHRGIDWRMEMGGYWRSYCGMWSSCWPHWKSRRSCRETRNKESRICFFPEWNEGML